MRTWASPFGMLIQPDALIVPRRPTFVVKQHPDYGWPTGSHLLVEGHAIARLVDRTSWPARPGGGACEHKMDLASVSCPRWDLSHLTSEELASLIVAADEQLSVGAGNPCPAWNKPEQRRLTRP